MSLKLNTLKLTGFKCYNNSGIIPFHDLTVVIGENDSGKSTIYDALDYFLNNKPMQEDDYRDGCDTTEIIGTLNVPEEIDELSNYILNGSMTIKKTFRRSNAI